MPLVSPRLVRVLGVIAATSIVARQYREATAGNPPLPQLRLPALGLLSCVSVLSCQGSSVF
jgi:hypothetical protein